MRVELADHGRVPKFEVQMIKGGTVYVISLDAGRQLARWISELDPAAQQLAEADRAGWQDAVRLALAYLSAHGPAGVEDMPAHVAAILACEAALGPAV